MSQPVPRIAFAGTPDFAAQHLKALLEHNSNIVAVFSQPDRPSGRGKTLAPSPVKALALEHDIPVFQPHDLRSSTETEMLQALNLDLLIVVAYGLLLPEDLIKIPRHGCLNVHASLLPRWRGAAPIERAILNGDSETGICIMQMDAGLDTGDVLLALSCPIQSNDTSQDVTSNLVKLGCEGLLTVLDQIATDTLKPQPQDHSLSTYAKKLDKHEALLQWDKSAIEIQQCINAFYPRSPAYSFINQHRVRIIQSRPDARSFNASPGTVIEFSEDGLLVACLDSSLLISQLQFAGKKVTSIGDLLNHQKPLFSIADIFLPEPLKYES